MLGKHHSKDMRAILEISLIGPRVRIPIKELLHGTHQSVGHAPPGIVGVDKLRPHRSEHRIDGHFFIAVSSDQVHVHLLE
jgi:hypothetical protein